MGTPYKKVFKSFLSKIEDIDFAHFSKEDQLHDLKLWLNEALTYMEMSDLFLDHDLTLRSDKRLEFSEQLSKTEIELIAIHMVAAWYSRRVNSLEHTSLFVGSSGEKWTDQKNHLEAMRSSRDYWYKEGRKLFRNTHILNNSYLNDN